MTMSNREQTQADLLDQFRQEWSETPPTGLDTGVAATAVMLREHLSPPAPSARFVQTLGRRLETEATPAGNHRQAGVLPLLPDQTIPPSPPANDWSRDSGDEPHRPWFFEAARIAAAGLAIALFGTILVLLFRDADEAVAPGAGETEIHTGEILVSWGPNGGEDYKLFIVNANDGDLRKLTPGPAEADGETEHSPAWSPDGHQVAFLQGTENESNLYVINADGSNLFNISDAAGIGFISDFSWSPDGTQIALSVIASNATGIYVVEVDGSNLRRLTAAGETGWGTAWSPYGTQIAFISLGRPGSIQVVDPDGGNLRSLNSTAFADYLTWSPDGTQLAFTAGRFINSVYTMNADGTELQPFTDQTTMTSVQPEWSPDGQSIAFVAYDDGGSVSGTFISDANGSDWRPLTPVKGFHAWSPDGNQLAIIPSGLDRNGNPISRSTLYVINDDGSQLRPLIQDVSLALEPPAWRPPITREAPPPAAAATPTPIPATETAARRLYVVTSNGVTVMDAMSNQEIYSIDATNPDAALSPDGSRLYVLGAGNIFRLTAFDAADGTELWNAPVEDRIRWIGDHGPSTLAVSPDSNHVYLATSSAPDTQQIQVFDASTGEWIDESETIIGYCPAVLRPSADGNSLLLVCIRRGHVHEIDLQTLTLPAGSSGSAKFGANFGAVMSPDGTLLYVVTSAANGYGVALIQADGSSEGGTLERRGGVIQLAEGEYPPMLGEMVTLSPDGTRLYVALGTEDNDRDPVSKDVREIAVFDTTSWEEVDRIALDVPLKRGAFTMSPEGQYIYASERLQSESDGKLIRIDVESGETSTVLVRNAEILRVFTATPRQAVDPAPPIPPVEQEEEVTPRATLAFVDASQVGEFAYGCMWPGFPVCVDPAGLRFPERTMYVPAGTEITFTVDGMSDLVNVQAHAYPLNEDATVEDLQGTPFLTYPPPPMSGLPTSPSSTQPVFAANLPTGEYAIAVDVDNSSHGSATYGFHIIVWDETPELSNIPPPRARLSYGDQEQVWGTSSYCWTAPDASGFCVEDDREPPPEPALVVPPDAELTFTVDGIEDFEVLGASANALVADNGEITYSGSNVDLSFNQMGTHAQLVASLPEGDYAISVGIEAQLSDGLRLDAGYQFRVRVGDPANAPTRNEFERPDLTDFDHFPIWSLGETFGEFVLGSVEEHFPGRSGTPVSVKFIYVAEDGRTGAGITIISQGPLSESELQAREESRQGLGAPVVINGQDGWMTPVDDNARTIEFARDNGYLTIFATDEGTALAAAEAVRQVNEP